MYLKYPFYKQTILVVENSDSVLDILDGDGNGLWFLLHLSIRLYENPKSTTQFL